MMEIAEGVEGLTDSTEVLREYDTPAYATWRAGVYHYTIDGRNLEDEIVGWINPQPTDVVLDVGCSQGTLLKAIHESQPDAQLFGVEMPGFKTLTPGKKYDNLPFTFSYDNITNLHFEDNSVTVAIAKNMLYHVGDIEKALEELKRVTVPGGLVVIATKGPLNKNFHREFEGMLALEADAKPPPSFTAPFNTDKALEMLPQHFRVVGLSRQETTMHFDHSNVLAYYESLDSMRESFDPPFVPYRKWKEAINKCVRPVINAEIKRVGYFSDTVHQEYYICQNMPPIQEFGGRPRGIVVPISSTVNVDFVELLERPTAA